MQDILSMRACRFRALHSLLTGMSRGDGLRLRHLSPHIARDIGVSAPREAQTIVDPTGRTLTL